LFSTFMLFACMKKNLYIYIPTDKNKATSFDRFEIFNDTLLFMMPNRSGYLAKGELLRINDRQAIFKSFINVDSNPIVVIEKTHNDENEKTKIVLNNYCEKFGNSWMYLDQGCNIDSTGRFSVVINDLHIKNIKAKDTLTISLKVQFFRVEYETCRIAPNRHLKTNTFFPKKSESNFFEIETFFDDYGVFALNITDTLTFLPFNRINFLNKTYRRTHSNKYLPIHVKYGYPAPPPISIKSCPDNL